MLLSDDGTPWGSRSGGYAERGGSSDGSDCGIPSPSSGPFPVEWRHDTSIAGFASRVVAMIAARGATASPVGEVALAELVARFVDASVDSDRRRLDDCLASLQRNRAGSELLLERILPDAARALGVAWSDDRLSFADVSLGVARLQALLRNPAVAAAPPFTGGGTLRATSEVLMIVPKGEQHTMGALAAAIRMRRNGVAVSTRIGPGRTEVGGLMRKQEFDAVFVSVGRMSSLEMVREILDLKQGPGPRHMPVVVGGALLQDAMEDVKCLGVDLVCDDPIKALRICGLDHAKDRSASAS